MELDKEQRACAEGVLRTALSKGVGTLGGYAGTGKTTVLAYLHERLKGWAFVAFTGKAASNLRKKGVNASTIHSTIYRPVGNPVTDWELKHEDQMGCAGFAIDEGSMVGGSLFGDLASYGKPIVVVGDHGQLPPVADSAGLMEDPDFRLERIHRNAGPIAEFAQWLRCGGEAAAWPGASDGGPVRILRRGEAKLSHALEADQVIVPFNDGRKRFNAQIRRALGMDGLVTVGDRVIVLRNSRAHGVFNGQQGSVVEVCDEEMVLDTGQRFPWRFGLEGDCGVPVDHAYCVTCHKAQGDEFDWVYVMEGPRVKLWPHERWTYTAASRARKRLTWVLPT